MGVLEEVESEASALGGAVSAVAGGAVSTVASAAGGFGLMGYLVLGLGAALVCSGLAIKVLWSERDDMLKAAGAQAAQTGAWQASAGMCSANTDRLASLAFQRGRQAAADQAKAHAKALEGQGRAQQELATPAAVPGDDYASAMARVGRWETRRSKP